MILQRDRRLDPDIQKNGCYLISILFLINKYTNYEWDTNKINDFYRAMVHLGYVEDHDVYVLDPDNVFLMGGMKVKYNDRHDVPGYACDDDEIEILYFKRGAVGHFVVGDGHGHVAYDPWGVSNTVRFGKLHSKRIFRRL